MSCSIIIFMTVCALHTLQSHREKNTSYTVYYFQFSHDFALAVLKSRFFKSWYDGEFTSPHWHWYIRTETDRNRRGTYSILSLWFNRVLTAPVLRRYDWSKFAKKISHNVFTSFWLWGEILGIVLEFYIFQSKQN